MILNTMKCNICVNLFIYSVENMEPHNLCYNLERRGVKKIWKRKCVMTVFNYCPLSQYTQENVTQRILNHSFRTFFPLKILNCFCHDIWQREKCEFDMILIFKLHISLLFIFTHTISQKGTLLLSAGRTQFTQCTDPGGTRV
jgi:hypothetical protein